jgi:hypothetical protein
MSKNSKKIPVGTVVIDQAKAMRTISRGVFGHLATTSVPDKKRKEAHKRHPKHRRPYSE